MLFPELPNDHLSAEDPDWDIAPIAEVCAVQTPSAPKKILVLEDDPTQLFLITQCLESLGLSVVEATTIAQANSQLELHRIVLAVLDIHLPDGSGLDLCAKIDESPAYAGMPIIVLSNTRQQDIVRQSRAAGGCFFLGKPYDPNVLLTIVESLLREL